MVLSVPGEVLCSRKVLVLLVTFDLWLSLCFVCVRIWVFFFFLDFVVVLLLRACWTWAGCTPLGYRGLPAAYLLLHFSIPLPRGPSEPLLGIVGLGLGLRQWQSK